MGTFSIRKELHFCYGHRLVNYRGKCAHLHGHNARVEITLRAGKTDRLGMVMDFSAVKRTLLTWIEKNLDHRMILNRRDPAIPMMKKLGEPVFLMDGNPTAEALARLIFRYARSQKLPIRSVTLWETPSSSATYQE